MMNRINLTRCPNCLTLTFQNGHKGCDLALRDQRALFLLHMRGYRVYHIPRHKEVDVVWLLNDDPDDLQFEIVAHYVTLTPYEIYTRLEAADWPTKADHRCPECKEADSSGLEWCDRCKGQFQMEGAGKW